MKKRIIVLFTAIMVTAIMVIIGFALFGKIENEPAGSETASTLSSSETQPISTEISKKEYKGAQITLSACNKNNDVQYFNIKLPTDEGREIRYGRGSAALDGTWVLCGRSILNETIECNSIENIYDAFVGRWEEAVQDMRHDSAYSDCKFIAEKHEMTEINGFSMCRYEGTHTYNYTDFTTGEITSYSCYFVAYGTQLSEGGYVYWIVFDNSEDQSLKDLVNSNAENMAKSLKETE